ncbi:TRAP transporter substrate-binding protein [Ramlibacter sp. AN1133]|uniref:TRAP transporter substrate-binding protein n=1 Tax=Ramlibacter sp. AN1133 TaxID=3133429 RepID=UPI0030C14E4B
MKYAFAGALAATTMLASTLACAQAVSLNVGHTLAPDSHYQIAAVRMAEIAAKKSNGQIKINVFPQSQLGGEVKMIQAARTGGLDMFITAQAPLTNTIKAYSLFDMPYLFDGVDQANNVLSGSVGKEFLAMLPKYNLVGLGFLSVMERNVFSSKPIRSGTDMQGMKIRVMQSPGYVKAYESFGAQPTPMAYGDVYMALQQGVVDGADTSPDQFVMDKFVEVSKFYNITRVHYLPALLIASKTTWDKLTPDQRKIVQDSATEALAESRAYYKKSYADSIASMKKAGVQVVESNVDNLKQASAKVDEQLLSGIPDGKALFDKVQAAKKAVK